MFEKIVTLEEHIAANLDPRPHIVAALKAIATRIEEIGRTADGAVAEQVTAIDERLSSLTSAVSGLGSTVSALGSSVATLGSLSRVDGTVVSLGERLATLEAKAQQPAAPEAPPVPPQQ